MAYRYYQSQRPEGTSQSSSSRQMAPSSASSGFGPSDNYYSSYPPQASRAYDPSNSTSAYPVEYSGGQHSTSYVATQPSAAPQVAHAAHPSAGRTQPGVKSKYAIVKEGWGNMHNFMDSYGLKREPEGYKEVNSILNCFQEYDEENLRAEQAEAADRGARGSREELARIPDAAVNDGYNDGARGRDGFISSASPTQALDHVLRYESLTSSRTSASDTSSYVNPGPISGHSDDDQGHNDHDEAGGEDGYGYDGEYGDDDGYDDGGYDAEGNDDDGGYCEDYYVEEY